MNLRPLRVLATALLLACCAPVPPPPGPQLAVRRVAPEFALTVKYIDDGVKFIDPVNAFFIDYAGEMCFRGVWVAGERSPLDQRNYWCVDPRMVGSVDALANDISYVPAVRVWCKHANPYCAHRVGEPEFPWFGTVGMSNSITVSAVPFREEKTAVEHLVRLLGGRLDTAEPLH